MKIEEIDELNKNIKVAIPLTGQTSKQELKVEIYGMVMVIQLQQGRKNLSLILI